MHLSYSGAAKGIGKGFNTTTCFSSKLSFMIFLQLVLSMINCRGNVTEVYTTSLEHFAQLREDRKNILASIDTSNKFSVT